MELLADPGLALTAFSAGTGSTDDDSLKLLASWAATHDPADALATPNSREPGPLCAPRSRCTISNTSTRLATGQRDTFPRETLSHLEADQLPDNR